MDIIDISFRQEAIYVGCEECKFRQFCEELEYTMDCKDYTKCEHYDAFLEGLEEYD